MRTRPFRFPVDLENWHRVVGASAATAMAVVHFLSAFFAAPRSIHCCDPVSGKPARSTLHRLHCLAQRSTRIALDAKPSDHGPHDLAACAGHVSGPIRAPRPHRPRPRRRARRRRKTAEHVYMWSCFTMRQRAAASPELGLCMVNASAWCPALNRYKPVPSRRVRTIPLSLSIPLASGARPLQTVRDFDTSTPMRQAPKRKSAERRRGNLRTDCTHCPTASSTPSRVAPNLAPSHRLQLSHRLHLASRS